MCRIHTFLQAFLARWNFCGVINFHFVMWIDDDGEHEWDVESTMGKNIGVMWIDDGENMIEMWINDGGKTNYTLKDALGKTCYHLTE